jgi:hypothetical protein
MSIWHNCLMNNLTGNKLQTAGFILLLGLTILIYFPALSSDFQLDDVNNLGRLAAVDEKGIFHFIFSGAAGPSGRPLSLFTFALQHSAWPGNTFAFKAVNLAIHLACGWLIFQICRKLAVGRKLNPQERLIFCLAVTLLWLLHPMHLTTVLYVVQRMAQLSALFILLGIFLYLHIREEYLKSGQVKHLLGMGAAIWFCTLLGVLSKENGVLLPLFILVINSTLLAGTAEDNRLQQWNRVFLGLPLAMVIIYLASGFDNVLASYHLRPFSMAERLMTQAVILVEYLQHLVFPYPGAFSIYHDDFPVSRGLLDPPWTLASIIIIFLLISSAIIFRRKFVICSFAVLWFFAGHVLESTYLNLELYFEHRNYLPSLGVFVLLAYTAITAARYLSRPALAYSALVIYCLLVVGNTLPEIRLWTKPVERHLELVHNHPGSARAVTALGNLLIAGHELDNAERLYRTVARQYPGEIYPHIKLMAIKACVISQELHEAEWQELVGKAETAQKTRFGVVEELALIVSAVSEKDCKGINLNSLTRLIVTLALNPHFQKDRAALHELAARLGILTGDAGVAYHNIVAADKYAATVPRRILKLQILLALGLHNEAEATMAALENMINRKLRLKLAYHDIVTAIRKQMDKTGQPLQVD